ncbi:MAG TPA: hypothetical protein VHG89_11425 [Verrucomicrobiae bacterium]|nr:hypothetical protein [Verrucomicrobiae bacterium]
MQRFITDRDIKDGFWYYRPKECFPPSSIRNPADYIGLPTVSIACTQTGLPAHQQTKLVKEWCKILPTCRGLKFVWFQTQLPQNLFDAACQIPDLEGLWIKWSSVKEITNIVKLTNLKFLRVGSSPQILKIDSLKNLKNLVWLELENIKKVSNLTVIGEMTQLQGLELGGSMWSRQIVDSLAPLANLKSLRYLSLPNLKAKDKTLSHLFTLSSLEQFNAAIWWDKNEIKQLRMRNPKLN